MGRRAEGFRVRFKRGWAYVRFTHEGIDHRVALRTRDPREAQTRAAEEYAAALSGRRRKVLAQRGGRAAAVRPLEVLLAEWIAAQRGVYDETTCATLETYAKTFDEFFDGRLDHITRESGKDFSRARLRSVLRKTVLKELTFLRGFLAWAVDAGELDEAPLIDPPPAKATGVRSGKQRAAPVEVTEEQALAIVEALPKESKRIGGRKWPIRDRFVFAWETGLRPATLARLSVPVHYRPGAEQLELDDADDKARFGRRLPLSQPAKEALERVCPSKGLIFGRHNFDKVLKSAARQVLGEHLGDRFASYDFRHGRGTHLVGEGAPLTGVAYLLGHRRVSTTDRYVRPSRRDAERALAAVGSAPFPPPGDPHGIATPPKAAGSLGDRRVSNPRQLEPQRSGNAEIAEGSTIASSLETPENPARAQHTRPGGAFAARVADAVEEAFAEDLAVARAWDEALAASLDGDEELVLAALRRLAEDQ